jgi:hypothetical protein
LQPSPACGRYRRRPDPGAEPRRRPVEGAAAAGTAQATLRHPSRAFRSRSPNQPNTETPPRSTTLPSQPRGPVSQFCSAFRIAACHLPGRPSQPTGRESKARHNAFSEYGQNGVGLAKLGNELDSGHARTGPTPPSAAIQNVVEFARDTWHAHRADAVARAGVPRKLVALHAAARLRHRTRPHLPADEGKRLGPNPATACTTTRNSGERRASYDRGDHVVPEGRSASTTRLRRAQPR